MKNITILIVDDIEANIISLEYLIEEYLDNIELLLAQSGEEALKISTQKNIDIIILDIQMPGLDGFDTAKCLKNNPKTNKIPIIFLTAAFKEEEFRRKGFEIGAIDYLTKPIENLQFVNKLKLYMEIILKTKELEELNHNLSQNLKKEIELKERIQKQQLELIERSKMASLGEMIGNIAHQWRQPLSIISTCASGIQLNIELDNLNKKDLIFNTETIIQNTQELSKTIDAFRDISYKDTLKKFNLSKSIQNCLESQSNMLNKNNISVIYTLDDNIDLKNLPISLTHALMNLIINAKEALEKIDSIRYIFITTIIENDNCIIKIKDNALGVQKEYLEKVFEPFFTTKTASHGVGLGLNIVYKIINESMQGKIQVKNSTYSYRNNTYTGAEFIITIPIEI